MKLWLISQTINTDYDTYDAAIVAAETEEEAKAIHPSPYVNQKEWPMDTWAAIDEVSAKYIGEASPDISAGTVIVSSFNAG